MNRLNSTQLTSKNLVHEDARGDIDIHDSCVEEEARTIVLKMLRPCLETKVENRHDFQKKGVEMIEE